MQTGVPQERLPAHGQHERIERNDSEGHKPKFDQITFHGLLQEVFVHGLAINVVQDRQLLAEGLIGLIDKLLYS